MTSVLGRLQNFDKVLTPSEVKVAEFIRRRPEEVVDNSIKAAAALAGVSIASASRLAATLGYRDWKEMRHNLVKDLAGAPETVFADVSRDDSGEAVIKKIFDCSILSLRDTFDQVEAGDILKVVAAIKKTDRLVFFGTGRSGCFAMEESLRFAGLDISAEAYSDEYQMILQASRIRKDQVCFGFSNSGRSRAAVGALATAKKNKAITIGIANYKETPLERVSDIYFCTSFPRVGEISSSLTARIALLCIMDAIYFLSAQGIDSSASARLADRLINRSLRLPAKGRDVKEF
ncbi:MAG: MurR/RpiR family transcriptional regulator [Planctomycetota bacterium]|jgi:DNA-binding MurR/RpiR family transcriptional regulator|nr:MurR/RpiR family transcriptional regulator [Planctomycetota bacterium]